MVISHFKTHNTFIVFSSFFYTNTTEERVFVMDVSMFRV